MTFENKYIAFEGVDGAGKTTQCALLANWFERHGITPIILVEPTYGPQGLPGCIVAQCPGLRTVHWPQCRCVGAGGWPGLQHDVHRKWQHGAGRTALIHRSFHLYAQTATCSGYSHLNPALPARLSPLWVTAVGDVRAKRPA